MTWRVALGCACLGVALLHSLDVAATWLVLHDGGHEVNPLQALVLARWGFTGLLVDKALCALLCALSFYWVLVRLRLPILFAVYVLFSCACLTGIVWFDLHSILAHHLL